MEMNSPHHGWIIHVTKFGGEYIQFIKDLQLHSK